MTEGFDGPADRYKDHPRGWTRHIESQTRRTLKATEPDVPQPPHHQSGTYGRLVAVTKCLIGYTAPCMDTHRSSTFCEPSSLLRRTVLWLIIRFGTTSPAVVTESCMACDGVPPPTSGTPYAGPALGITPPICPGRAYCFEV